MFVEDTFIITQTNCAAFTGGEPAGQFSYGTLGSETSGTGGSLLPGQKIVLHATTTNLAPTGVSLCRGSSREPEHPMQLRPPPLTGAAFPAAVGVNPGRDG